MGYLSTVSVPQALWRRLVLWLVENGLGKNLKRLGFGLFEELSWHSLGSTGENCRINQLGWPMLDRDTDLAPQERKSEALAVDPACSVKVIEESKVLLEKWFSNPRPVGLYCAVLRYILKIFLYY